MSTEDRKNLIILTAGLSGSSAVAGLLSRAGYWTGRQTHKKRDYDTYENEELIQLNRRILAESGYSGNYEMEFSRPAIQQVEDVASRLDMEPFAAFVKTCDEHGPWLWKDPRLWLTIRFWKRVLNLGQTQFIVLSRDDLQTWISTTIRRQIHTYEYSKRYSREVYESILQFLQDNQLPYLKLVFEDLVVKPGPSLDSLNSFLGTSLEIDDLKATYHNRLYRKPRGVLDLAKAIMIYSKNYGQRYR